MHKIYSKNKNFPTPGSWEFNSAQFSTPVGVGSSTPPKFSTPPESRSSTPLNFSTPPESRSSTPLIFSTPSESRSSTPHNFQLRFSTPNSGVGVQLPNSGVGSPKSENNGNSEVIVKLGVDDKFDAGPNVGKDLTNFIYQTNFKYGNYE